jgi:hypothetical protein
MSSSSDFDNFDLDFNDPYDFIVGTVKVGKGKSGGKKKKEVYSGKGVRAKEANIARGAVATIGGAKGTASTGKK